MDLAKICPFKVIMEREKCLDALDLDLFSIFCLILSDLTAENLQRWKCFWKNRKI